MMSNFISNLKKLVLDKYARNSFLSYYFKSFKLTGVHAVITKEWAILKGPRESLIPDMVETTEKPILDLIKNLTLTGTCIDVGAWIGYYTLLLSRKARKIIAIEPDPRNQQYLIGADDSSSRFSLQPHRRFPGQPGPGLQQPGGRGLGLCRSPVHFESGRAGGGDSLALQAGDHLYRG